MVGFSLPAATIGAVWHSRMGRTAGPALRFPACGCDVRSGGSASRRRRRRRGQASAAAAEVEAALEVPLDPRAAAFFDVDNTVMQGASIFHLARGLYARDFFTARDIGRFAWQQGKFRLLGREDMGNVHEARETALSFAAGHTVAELTTIGEEVFDEVMAAKVWPGTRALAQMHLDAGQRVWLVTATPVEVASVIARRLGLTGALGTVAETEDGVYTGRLVGEILHGEAKARGGHARWPSGRGSTSAPARRTPTRPTTSRCCPWSGTRAPSTRTAGCAPTPGSTAGGCATTGPGARR